MVFTPTQFNAQTGTFSKHTEYNVAKHGVEVVPASHKEALETVTSQINTKVTRKPASVGVWESGRSTQGGVKRQNALLVEKMAYIISR